MAEKQVKILLAEDDHYLLGLYGRKFNEEDFQVYSARDGLETLRLFEKYRPQVVVMDIDLPKMSGQEVLSVIAQDTTNHHPLCLVLSNYDRDIAELKGKLPSIVAGYLLKIETTPDDLVDKIRELLNNKK